MRCAAAADAQFRDFRQTCWSFSNLMQIVPSARASEWSDSSCRWFNEFVLSKKFSAKFHSQSRLRDKGGSPVVVTSLFSTSKSVSSSRVLCLRPKRLARVCWYCWHVRVLILLKRACADIVETCVCWYCWNARVLILLKRACADLVETRVCWCCCHTRVLMLLTHACADVVGTRVCWYCWHTCVLILLARACVVIVGTRVCWYCCAYNNISDGVEKATAKYLSHMHKILKNNTGRDWQNADKQRSAK